MKIEPVDQAQVDALIRAVGPTAAMVASLFDVDLSRGRGVLDGNSRCLWTAKGRRITVEVLTGGGFCVSCGKQPDPDVPLPQPAPTVTAA